MWWIILSVLFFVLALYGYKQRKETSWGAPLLVLSVLALIATVAVPRLSSGRTKPNQGRVQRMMTIQERAAQLAGEALRPHVASGAEVLLLVPWPPALDARAGGPALYLWRPAIEEGLGMDWVEIGTLGPAQELTAGDVLDEMGPMDAVISFDGLPKDPEDFAGQVAFVAVFQGADAAAKERIGQLLREGVLVGAVIITGEEVVLHTSGNLP